MSGAEIVVAAAAVSLISSGVSAYEQVQVANESAKTQSDQIRTQQVQLRLQQNQASIERMKALEKTLASQEVSFGVKNIAPGSSIERGLSLDSYHNFLDDENADKLNFASKQMALARQNQLVWTQRKAQVFNAATGFIKEGAGTVMAAYGVPSQSLIEKSVNGGSSSNVGGSYGAQTYQAQQRKQFDLNA